MGSRRGCFRFLKSPAHLSLPYRGPDQTEIACPALGRCIKRNVRSATLPRPARTKGVVVRLFDTMRPGFSLTCGQNLEVPVEIIRQGSPKSPGSFCLSNPQPAVGRREDEPQNENREPFPAHCLRYLSKVPWQRPRGVATGSHRKSGVLNRLTSACPVELYLLLRLHTSFIRLSRANCKPPEVQSSGCSAVPCRPGRGLPT